MALKIFGGLLLVISGTLVGLLYSKRLFLYREFYKKIINFSSSLSVQLRYSTADIFTLTALCADTAEIDFFDFKNEKNLPFSAVWSKNTEAIPSKFGLNRNDKQLLLEFGEQLGKTDVEGQLKHLELYEEIFKKQLENAETEIKNKSKLYKTMGFFVGTAVALMII